MTNEECVEFIRDEIKKKGWSQAETARKAKVSPAPLSGQKRIGDRTLAKLLEALGFDYRDFLEEKKCEKCGKLFVRARSCDTKCDECYAKMKVTSKKSDLTDVNERAIESGTTYGKYVAMNYMPKIVRKW